MKFFTALLLCALATGAAAQTDLELTISELSAIDRQYMDLQRKSLQELAGKHLGRRLSGERDNDLEVMQALLDRRHVKPDQVAELQAMGMVMGDLLAQDLGLHWVVYTDRVGRTRALRYRDTDAFLFPVTLVSRRWEAGDRTPVAVIYATARDNMREDLPPVPFQ